MIHPNHLLDLELSCGKWSSEKQLEVLELLKSVDEELEEAEVELRIAIEELEEKL